MRLQEVSGLTAGRDVMLAPSFCGGDLQIGISPTFPMQYDAIQVLVAGEWPDSCVPRVESHQWTGHVLRVDAIADYPVDTACALVITPWEITAEAGRLSDGPYSVDAYVKVTRFDVTTLCATRSFWVFAEPTVSFSRATYSVGEADGNATVIATLYPTSALTVSVAYGTADGSAVAGVDYLATSGTLTFTPGITRRAFVVPILNDALQEPHETITLTLSHPANGTLGLFRSATLTILDDEPFYAYLPLVKNTDVISPGQVYTVSGYVVEDPHCINTNFRARGIRVGLEPTGRIATTRLDDGLFSFDNVANGDYILYVLSCAPWGCWAGTPVTVAGADVSVVICPAFLRSGKLDITDVFYDGVQGSQAPDEYVEIHNDDTMPIQLQGWTLRDEEDHVFRFPGHMMEPGQTCRVYTNEDHPEWCGFSADCRPLGAFKGLFSE
jgi:hypothetical protein